MYAARQTDDTGLLTEAELCRRLNCCRDTVRAQRLRGLPAVYLGRSVRYHWPSVLAWLSREADPELTEED